MSAPGWAAKVEMDTTRSAASAAPPLLLEREPEVAALDAMLDAARGGDGRLAAIEGAAGMGKTRLLAETRDRARAAGFAILTARGGELEGEFAFGIVRQLFEAPLAAAEPAVSAEVLSGAAGLSASLFASVPAATSGDGAESSFAMLHGLYWLAANFASRAPTLLLVDDLHWADEPSLRWLVYLAHRLEGLPLLLLAGTRPPEQANAPALVTELLADPTAVAIRLGALGHDSVAAVARERLGVEPDAGFAAALLEGCGGNPLFLVALLDAVWRDGIAPVAGQADRVIELGPQAISRGIATRLLRLPDEATRLLRAAATLGDRTALPLAAALAALPVGDALSAASALVAADLLRDENPLEFTHPIVRSAVLADMSAGERTSAHRRAAELLLEQGALPEQAATYLVRAAPAGDPFVVATLRAAAERSLAQGAPEAAVGYLRRALDEPPDSGTRADLLGDLGLAETHIDAVSAARHLRASVDELGDTTLRPDVVLGYARMLTMLAGWARESAALLEQLTERLGDRDRELWERIAAFTIVTCQFDPALGATVRDAWTRLREHELRHGIGTGLLLGVCSIEEARHGRSRERAIELGRRSVNSDLIDTLDRFEIVNPLASLAMAGEVEAALAGFAEVTTVARRRGDNLAAQTQQLWSGLVHYEAGMLLAAEEDLTIVERTPFWDLATPRAYRAGFLSQVLLERGRLAEAQTLVAGVRLDEVQVGHHIHFLYGRGRVRAQTGEIDEALADFMAAGAVADSIDIRNPAFVPWRSDAALALRRLGRQAEALELAREEVELSRGWGAPRTIGVSLRALGLLTPGRAGEQLLRDAVEALRDSPARLEHARALVDLGAALRRENRRSEARGLLREGVELALECGASRLAEQANDELAATGAHRRTVLLSGLEALTASERRVAQMAAEDLSNKEIAQGLFVTVKTVEQHLGRVYRKLDISSRRQLATALAGPAEAHAPA